MLFLIGVPVGAYLFAWIVATSIIAWKLKWPSDAEPGGDDWVMAATMGFFWPVVLVGWCIVRLAMNTHEWIERKKQDVQL